LSNGGKAVVHARRTKRGYLGGARKLKTIRLRKGRAASALLEGLLGAPAHGPRCRRYKSLRITPPNQTYSVVRKVAVPLCNLEIHPIIAGGRASDG
jgi:hypothetical protein